MPRPHFCRAQRRKFRYRYPERQVPEALFKLAARMGLTYFKRYRMEIDLAGRSLPSGPSPRGYELVPWSKELLEAHGDVKYLSFRSEIDANVFPCFGEREGCLRLMEEICRKEGFLPAATWLMRFVGSGLETPEYCGTIQGINDCGVGAIQNVGVTPAHRGRGVGTVLIRQALEGFRQTGLRRAYLEVTAKNQPAVELYHRLGFHKSRTLYKAVEVAYTS